MAKQHRDLFDTIQLNKSQCLNEDESHPFANAIKAEPSPSFLKSDADEQLLLTLQFKKSVKISAISMIAPEDGTAPAHVKLFVDRPDLDFSDAESIPCTDEVSFAKCDGTPQKVNFAKFQNVHSLSIFVDRNTGNKDYTVINHLALYGETRDTSAATSTEGSITQVENEAAWNEQLAAAGSKLVVVDFFATWCAPCRAIAPKVAELSEQHQDVVFLKVDVDKNKAVASKCGVRSMPTFQFYKRGAKVSEFSGANPQRLEDAIAELKRL